MSVEAWKTLRVLIYIGAIMVILFTWDESMSGVSALAEAIGGVFR